MMLSSPATSSRVYALLKDDILRGRFAPRTTLIERSLADDYGTSVTPIRNAASQLVGERLLSLHAGGGYEIPNVGVAELRDLYFWHGQLVRSALNPKRIDAKPAVQLIIDPLPELTTPISIATATARLFSAIAAVSSSSELACAVASAGERLSVARLREPAVLNGVADELRAVQALTVRGRWSDLVRSIWAYHRRRQRRVAEIAAAIGSPSRDERSY